MRGPLISWTRINSVVSETMVGSIDAQGRFKAEGQGSRQDRKEFWREQASGAFVAKTQRIEGRAQYIRPKDNAVTRECTLLAERGTALTVAAKGAPPPAAANAAAATSAATAGATGTASTAAAGAAKPPNKQPEMVVPQGTWKGQLACGASLSKNLPRPEADPFKADIVIEVSGTRIKLTRQRPTYLETTQGSIDAKGHFSAEGQGAYTDGRSTWLVRAWGDWVPGQQRIMGQVQLLRPADKAVSRECTLKAERA